MSQIRQFADTNAGSERNSTSLDDESTPLSLTKVEMEEMVNRMVQRAIEPIVEPLIRRLVKEEIELAKERILPSMNQNSGNKIHGSEPRSLQLQFLNKLSLPVLTGRPVKGENCSSVEIALVNASTGEVVKYGPEASAKVEMVVLRVDPDSDERHDWTPEEFNLKIVKGSKENKSLLTGNAFLNLNEGIGSADEISFAHRAKWMKRGQFSLGARVLDNFDGTRIREAKSEPFFLVDRRSELYKKHYPPSLLDKVWRLEKIGKGGALHKRLSSENVHSVKDFLTLFFINPTKLRNILGTAMSATMWEITVDHAQTCILDHRFYYYCPPGSQRKTGVVFNVVGQVIGLLSECQYSPIDKLSETEKAEAHSLVIAAFEQWGDVVSFDDEASLTDGLLHLFNNDLYSNSAMVGTSNGCKIFSSQMIGGFDYPQPSVCSSYIMPSIYSKGVVDSFDDFGLLHNIDSMDLRYDQPLNFPGQVVNSLICETETVTPFCQDEHLQHFDPDYSLQSLKSSLESKAELHTSVNGVILTSSATFAQRRWKVLISVLKWFSSIQRIVAKKTQNREKRRYR